VLLNVIGLWEQQGGKNWREYGGLNFNFLIYVVDSVKNYTWNYLSVNFDKSWNYENFMLKIRSSFFGAS